MGTKDTMLDGSKVIISHHAMARYTERFGADEEAMRRQLSRAVLFGAQRGEDRIYLDEDTAFVLDRYGVIKTTLTKSMLIANMQMAFRGIAVHDEPVNVDKSRSEVNLQFISSLATQDCSSCFPNCFGKQRRKSRNRQLRKLGFAPQGEQEKIYHEMFMAAYKEKIAEQASNKHVANNPFPETTRLAR